MWEKSKKSKAKIKEGKSSKEEEYNEVLRKGWNKTKLKKSKKKNEGEKSFVNK